MQRAKLLKLALLELKHRALGVGKVLVDRHWSFIPAYSTFYTGVSVEVMPALGTNTLLNPAPLSAEQVEQFLRVDIGPAPRHEIDVRFLEAAARDRAA